MGQACYEDDIRIVTPFVLFSPQTVREGNSTVLYAYEGRFLLHSSALTPKLFEVRIGLDEAPCPNREDLPGIQTALSALSAQRLSGKVKAQKLLHMLSWEGGMVSISPATLCSYAWLGWNRAMIG